MAKLSDYASPEEPGWFVLNGKEFGDATDFLQKGFLGFCDCGNPERNLEFVLEGLALIEKLESEVWTDRLPFDDWKALGNAHHGGDAGRYFFYYWMDKEGLTEHGGGVRWLTDKGKTLLALLREWREVSNG